MATPRDSPKGKPVETTKEKLARVCGIVRSQGNKNFELTQRNHDSQLRLTYRVTDTVNDGETGKPKPTMAWQSRAKPRNELGICVETKRRPLSRRGEEIVQSQLKGWGNCFAAMIIFGVA